MLPPQMDRKIDGAVLACSSPLFSLFRNSASQPVKHGVKELLFLWVREYLRASWFPVTKKAAAENDAAFAHLAGDADCVTVRVFGDNDAVTALLKNHVIGRTCCESRSNRQRARDGCGCDKCQTIVCHKPTARLFVRGP